MLIIVMLSNAWMKLQYCSQCKRANNVYVHFTNNMTKDYNYLPNSFEELTILLLKNDLSYNKRKVQTF